MVADTAEKDDVAREVYCVLGIPIDAIAMPAALERITNARAGTASFFISTPNLNFLVNAQVDPLFRESLLISDLCPPDGMPIVWIARLIGVPIKGRVAGSDMFDALKTRHSSATPLKIFFFGGNEGVAVEACRTLNEERCGLHCVGAVFPGFGTVEEMSQDAIIETINISQADILIASLGAKKGQSWLLRNLDKLKVPIRAHLGAVVSFQAGETKRAPPIWRQYGVEWLWRIKEEHHLWERYRSDGIVLLRLLFARVLPLAILMRLERWKGSTKAQDFLIKKSQDSAVVTLSLRGAATARHVDKAIPVFRDAITAREKVVVDFSKTHVIDARFLGLLLMLRKRLKERRVALALIGVSSRLRTMFHFYGADFLLSSDHL